MAGEFEFIERLRALATDPAARALRDDAALLAVDGARLVLTSDTLVEGVHFRASDPAASIGWKLAAVNLSDLSAKGADPVACLMNYALSGDAAWDAAFLEGLGAILAEYRCPLIGGDTVRMPPGASRSLTLTAIGRAGAAVPARNGARAGDALWVTGMIGNAGAGLAALRADDEANGPLVDTYQRPRPRVSEGRALAGVVSAMMDVSDGLLIDARRISEASGLAVRIDLDRIPLSAAFVAARGDDADARRFAATAGDDYELLFALPPGIEPPVPATRIGSCATGAGLTLCVEGAAVPLPPSHGWQH